MFLYIFSQTFYKIFQKHMSYIFCFISFAIHNISVVHKMSNNRIFSGVRFQTQGRTVNLSSTMLKRSSVSFNTQPQIQQVSPFANYNCKLNESNASESTLQQQRINQDIIRQIAKEEISKIPRPEETNRKVIATLQAQIADLKEKIGENERDTSKKIQQVSLTFKQEIRSQAQKVGKEVQDQISSKLRLFFQKVNAQLKKDILKCVQQDYLSIAYGEDVQNRLQTINQRIQSLNNQATPNQLKRDAEKKYLSQDIELRLNKAQKEIENLKKTLTELSRRTQIIEEFKVEEENHKLQREKEYKIEDAMKKINELQMNYTKGHNQLLIKLQASLSDIKSINHHVYQIERKYDSQKMTLMDLTKSLSYKESEGESTQQSNIKIAQNQSLLFQNNSFVDKPQAGLKKQVYQVDKEGYLMDGDGKYLLTPTNTLVKLTNEQISALFESNLIEIVDK